MAERLRAVEKPGCLAEQFQQTRALSEGLAQPLSDADASLQSMEDASPAKWHLAHTTWFWETFLLRDHLPGYRLFDERWPFLFNSYYEAEGERVARDRRGMLSRPSLADALAYRSHVTEAMQPLLERADCADLIALGIAHEQQHQELLLTDIKHALFQNPLGPAMYDTPPPAPKEAGEMAWHEHPGGIARIGRIGTGFSFDNEETGSPHPAGTFRASRPAGDKWRMAAVYGRWRLPQLGPVAVGRMELGAAGGGESAALLAASGWPVDAVHP